MSSANDAVFLRPMIHSTKLSVSCFVPFRNLCTCTALTRDLIAERNFTNRRSQLMKSTGLLTDALNSQQMVVQPSARNAEQEYAKYPLI